MLASTLT